MTGQCVEVPSEPAESGYAKKIKLKNYPLIEKGGVLWTYMGPTDKTPPEPMYEFCTVPLNQTFMTKRLQECNGCRRWKAASIPHTFPSCIAAISRMIRCSRARRQQVQHAGPLSCLRSRRE